jgi:hypothetical protein
VDNRVVDGDFGNRQKRINARLLLDCEIFGLIIDVTDMFNTLGI